jgi:hypothetical protein
MPTCLSLTKFLPADGGGYPLMPDCFFCEDLRRHIIALVGEPAFELRQLGNVHCLFPQQLFQMLQLLRGTVMQLCLFPRFMQGTRQKMILKGKKSSGRREMRLEMTEE